MVDASKNILDIISKLSSLEFQNDVWIEGKYWDRVVNLEEARNLLGDYFFFEDVDENRIGLLDEEQIKTKHFLDTLLKYKNRPAEDMLSDKAWQAIVKEANEIYKILKKYDWE